MSPTFTLTPVTGQVTETDGLALLLPLAEVDDKDDVDVAVAVVAAPVELDEEAEEAPLVATGVTPKARS
jgi:hypothetical protein